jgi:hypothetical protein
MVNRDKIRKRTGGDDKEDRRSEGSARRGGGGDSYEVDAGRVTISDDDEARGDKMDKLRKAKGLSEKEKTEKPVGRKGAAKALESMANILLYTEGKMRSYREPDTPREVVETNVTTSVYEQFTEIIAQGNVQLICEKYGIDWQEDVIKQVVSKQDFESDVGNVGSMDHGVVKVGGGSRFDNDDFWQLLVVLGQMQLFGRMVQDKVEAQNDPQNKMAERALQDINAKIVDFLGVFSVEGIAAEHGIDWKTDVLDKVTSQTDM